MQKTLTRAEQRKKALKARVAVAMYDEYSKVPSEDEIENTYRLASVLYKAALGTHYMRRQQQKDGQFVLFLAMEDVTCPSST